MQLLSVGTRIDHPRYGEGVVGKVGLTAYDIYFAHGGKVEILKNNRDITILEVPEGHIPQTETVSSDDLIRSITQVLDQYGLLPEFVEMGSKWEGGKLIIQPASNQLQAKEVPIEVFFHKIVMLRDRLRVLEQNINSHPKLSDEEKVHMQQYITRAYGSLTTFNVLFADKADYFVGSKKED